MIKFFLLLLACLIVGCSSKSRVRTDDCNYSCKSQKKLKQFCEDVELGGANCLEYSRFCMTVTSKSGIKFEGVCLDSAVYAEILDVFDGKFVGGGSVGKAVPSADSSSVGPFYVNGVDYIFSERSYDDEYESRNFCKSSDNQKCDMIFLIHTDDGPLYRYNFITKEIKSEGWPL